VFLPRPRDLPIASFPEKGQGALSRPEQLSLPSSPLGGRTCLPDSGAEECLCVKGSKEGREDGALLSTFAEQLLCCASHARHRTGTLHSKSSLLGSQVQRAVPGPLCSFFPGERGYSFHQMLKPLLYGNDRILVISPNASYFHFTDKETKAPRGWVCGPRALEEGHGELIQLSKLH
jgi:hypothetical protein